MRARHRGVRCVRSPIRPGSAWAISPRSNGRKEASSELLGAICVALDVPLSRVLADAAAELICHEDLARLTTVGSQVVIPHPAAMAVA